MERMTKTGNNNSKLLDSLVKAATKQPAKPEVEFDINTILKNNPTEPTLQEIFADVVGKSGKNITRIAQVGGFGGGMAAKPMPEPAAEEDAMFDEVGDIGEPPVDEEFDEELGGELGGECDQEAVKQNLVDALVALCGSPEEAAECVTNQTTMPPAEGLPGEEAPLDEPLGDGDELGGTPHDMAAEIPSAMPKAMPSPMAEPAPMPAPM